MWEIPFIRKVDITPKGEHHWSGDRRQHQGVNVGNSVHQESGDNSKVGWVWGVGRGVEGECGKLHSSGKSI